MHHLNSRLIGHHIRADADAAKMTCLGSKPAIGNGEERENNGRSREMEATVSGKFFSPPQEKVPRLPALNSALLFIVSVVKLWREVKKLTIDKNMFCTH